MSKKTKFALIITTVITVFVFLIKAECPDMSDSMVIGVSELKITNILEAEPSYELIFSYHNWSDELQKEIEMNLDEYAIVEVLYTIKNNSDKTAIEDIKFYPQINEELEPLIKTFNAGNDMYYIIAYPMLSSGMGQTIVIKRNGKTNEEIYRMISEMDVQMVYFTGDLKYNTGRGYAGIGKHTYSFKIKDAMDICFDSPEL